MVIWWVAWLDDHAMDTPVYCCPCWLMDRETVVVRPSVVLWNCMYCQNFDAAALHTVDISSPSSSSVYLQILNSLQQLETTLQGLQSMPAMDMCESQILCLHSVAKHIMAFTLLGYWTMRRCLAKNFRTLYYWERPLIMAFLPIPVNLASRNFQLNHGMYP